MVTLSEARLATLEATIERGVKDVGEALSEIRAEKLYTDKTFEAYCKRRWGFGRNYANKMIAANETAKHLGTIVPKNEVPTKEGQLREIGKAKPENQGEVLKAGNEIAAKEDREPQAKDYEAAREQVEGVGTIVPKTEPAPTVEPEPTAEQPAIEITNDFVPWYESGKRIIPDIASDLAQLVRDLLDEHHPVAKATRKTPTKRFKPPTVAEVREYGREYIQKRKQNREQYQDFDADKFHAFYESKGWMVGKTKMKDWKGAVRGWIIPKERKEMCAINNMRFREDD